MVNGKIEKLKTLIENYNKENRENYELEVIEGEYYINIEANSSTLIYSTFLREINNLGIRIAITYDKVFTENTIKEIIVLMLGVEE